jgi:hypothetical protein
MASRGIDFQKMQWLTLKVLPRTIIPGMQINTCFTKEKNTEHKFEKDSVT